MEDMERVSLPAIEARPLTKPRTSVSVRDDEAAAAAAESFSPAPTPPACPSEGTAGACAAAWVGELEEGILVVIKACIDRSGC